jgi:hypothetical protein
MSIIKAVTTIKRTAKMIIKGKFSQCCVKLPLLLCFHLNSIGKAQKIIKTRLHMQGKGYEHLNKYCSCPVTNMEHTTKSADQLYITSSITLYTVLHLTL